MKVSSHRQQSLARPARHHYATYNQWKYFIHRESQKYFTFKKIFETLSQWCQVLSCDLEKFKLMVSIFVSDKTFLTQTGFFHADWFPLSLSETNHLTTKYKCIDQKTLNKYYSNLCLTYLWLVLLLNLSVKIISVNR